MELVNVIEKNSRYYSELRLNASERDALFRFKESIELLASVDLAHLEQQTLLLDKLFVTNVILNFVRDDLKLRANFNSYMPFSDTQRGIEIIGSPKEFKYQENVVKLFPTIHFQFDLADKTFSTIFAKPFFREEISEDFSKFKVGRGPDRNQIESLPYMQAFRVVEDGAILLSERRTAAENYKPEQILYRCGWLFATPVTYLAQSLDDLESVYLAFKDDKLKELMDIRQTSRTMSSGPSRVAIQAAYKTQLAQALNLDARYPVVHKN